MEKMNPYKNFDGWYESQRKSNSTAGIYIGSGKNVMLMPCTGCRPYWKRKPVLQPNGNGLCKQCSPIEWDKEFSNGGKLTLGRVDEAKLSGWRVDYYEKLNLLHKDD
tara:strand:- start:386 stop:706 length:321 start_codon:yes stop_codon:yes gene_type:complete